MLSHINHIASEFQKEHGYPPNTLFLNRLHLPRLKLEFAGVDIEKILEVLGMDIRLEQDSTHPHVGWYDQGDREVG